MKMPNYQYGDWKDWGVRVVQCYISDIHSETSRRIGSVYESDDPNETKKDVREVIANHRKMLAHDWGEIERDGFTGLFELRYVYHDKDREYKPVVVWTDGEEKEIGKIEDVFSIKELHRILVKHNDKLDKHYWEKTKSGKIFIRNKDKRVVTNLYTTSSEEVATEVVNMLNEGVSSGEVENLYILSPEELEPFHSWEEQVKMYRELKEGYDILTTFHRKDPFKDSLIKTYLSYVEYGTSYLSAETLLSEMKNFISGELEGI